MDSASSPDPAVQAQLDRLAAFSPGADVLGLERITALLARLGHPERRLPPVLHVAGTNGKGSTCAFLRAALEAAGRDVHVYISPHLVRFNERIRLAGTLIDDAALAALLGETLDAAKGLAVSFFEATTAAAFLAFSRTPADACIVEVGLGGRLDATNALPAPLVCGIAQLGLDHAQFLGDRPVQVAAEKAGIAKPGVPLVTMRYPRPIAARIAAVAAAAGAPVLAQGSAWQAKLAGRHLVYEDSRGRLTLPRPQLSGRHQAMNAALAIAMLRHQERLEVPEAALAAAMTSASWPARLQRLGPGPLHALLPEGAELWLDGAHNPAAARAVAAFLRRARPARPLHIVCGLLSNKDADGVLAPLLATGAAFHAVPVPGHACHPPEALAAAARARGVAAETAADVEAALRGIGRTASASAPPRVLIAGSLYLAGEVLARNAQPPA